MVMKQWDEAMAEAMAEAIEAMGHPPLSVMEMGVVPLPN